MDIVEGEVENLLKKGSPAILLLAFVCLLCSCANPLPLSTDTEDSAPQTETEVQQITDTTEPSPSDRPQPPTAVTAEPLPPESIPSLSFPLSAGEEAERTLAEAVYTGSDDDGTLVYALYDTYAAVTGFSDAHPARKETVPVSLEIPAEHAGLPVRVIAANAFSAECGICLDSLLLPEGLWKIEESAFRDQHYLRSVALPDSILTVGEMAFLCRDPGEEHAPVLTLSSTVLSPGQGAFRNEKRFDASR
ncbi:MAG: hypothetical protein IJD06_01910 [Clostridia bacterium]|nr:hypothetical protein [Clostridia bacterium]